MVHLGVSWRVVTLVGDQEKPESCFVLLEKQYSKERLQVKKEDLDASFRP